MRGNQLVLLCLKCGAEVEDPLRSQPVTCSCGAEVAMFSNYELRRGDILVVDASAGRMRCAKCGVEWHAQVRPGSDGLYKRGAWTCFSCGANSKRGPVE